MRPVTDRLLRRLLLAVIIAAQAAMPFHAGAMQRSGLTVEICGAVGRVTVLLPATDDGPDRHAIDPCLGLCTMAALPVVAPPAAREATGRGLARATQRRLPRRREPRRSNRPRDPPRS